VENCDTSFFSLSTQVLVLILVFFLQAKGKGYAMNTSEELEFVKKVASSTGVILDPVYRYVSLSNSSLFLVMFMVVTTP